MGQEMGFQILLNLPIGVRKFSHMSQIFFHPRIIKNDSSLIKDASNCKMDDIALHQRYIILGFPECYLLDYCTIYKLIVRGSIYGLEVQNY